MTLRQMAFVVATLLATGCPEAFAGYVSGVDLAGWIKASERVTLGTESVKDSGDRVEAIGYLKGVIDASSDQFCIPEQMVLSQAQLVVAKFLSDNPKYLNLNASLLVVAAMKDAFPCIK